MEIKGQSKLFIKELKSAKGGTFRKYNTNISSKDSEGKYVNIPVDVIFNKENYPEATMNKLDLTKCYDLDIKSGYLLAREYEANGSKKQVVVFFVNDCTINNPKSISSSSKKDSLV